MTEITKEQEEASKSSSASEVKEDVVIIDGKARPLKNYMAEASRKIKDDILNEVRSQQQVQQPVRQQVSDQDWTKQLQLEAEREMEETGSLVPVRTVANMATRIAQYQLGEFQKSNKNAQKTIKDSKRELKGQYKDFSKHEEELDEMLESIDPQTITKEGVIILFNSLRGRKIDDLMAAREKEILQDAEENRKVIGATGNIPGSQNSRVSEKLTAEQIQEMNSMGFETEEDYIGRLNKIRDIAKRQGAKNVLNLISDRPVYK